MRKPVLVAALVGAVVGAGAVTGAQDAIKGRDIFKMVKVTDPAPNQGPVSFGRRKMGVPNESVFSGRADDSSHAAQGWTYRGHASLTFPDAHIVVKADEMVWNGNEVSLTGNVRIALDSQ